jgi:hypothetical protein
MLYQTPLKKDEKKERKGKKRSPHRSERINFIGTQTLLNPASLTNAYERLLSLTLLGKCLLVP